MLKEAFQIEGGKFSHPQKMREVIGAWTAKQKDGIFELAIKRLSDKRTGRQNRYYRLLLSILAPALGYESPDTFHCVIMKECGFGKYVKFRGKPYFERDFSRDFDIQTFKILIDKAFEIAAFENESREPESHIILPRVDLGFSA